ncbi:LysR family transcriptional regulator [Hydrogenophaga sp. OTU3427]|uniref:LysR family transcriptional regulator n=1 Tax=Hydrogenophaga sp. OTU3427 TaxID=3043856 RepID=UPI00313C886E
MQDLNDLMYFAEVVDRGGFAAAGRALGIPKSRLSRRVAELETRLGVRLLQRSTRKLSLTAVGEQYHRHCVAMRDNALAADEAVAHAQTEPRGTVRVACPVTLAQTTVGPILPQFLARYPLVTVDMQVSNRAVDLIEEGFDVALRVRQTLDDSGSLVVKNFGATQALLVAGPAQLARQGTPRSVADLHGMDTVAMSAPGGRAVWHLLGPDGATHVLEHRPRCVADDLLTLLCAARAGTGVAVLPDYMCLPDLQAGRLVQLLPGWAPRQGIFHAVFPSRRGLVPAVRKFLDFLGEHIEPGGRPKD